MRRARDPKRDDRRARRDREVAERLTFLERLALRVQPTRQVPAESGVRFAIGSIAKRDGICLVFQVDDPDVPIVEEGQPRPDYLVVHASRAGTILTIVEMKGAEQKNIEHGIDQIRSMARRLREEMARTLPGSWRKVHIQGVLLMPFNAQINYKKIEDASRAGIDIQPLQYQQQIELYPYVSTKVSRTQRYQHARHRRDPPELNTVERLIAEGTLARRVRDAFFAERGGDDDETFFLSFRHPGDPEGAYVSLSATTRDAVIGFSAGAGKRMDEVEAHRKQHGLTCPHLHARALGP